MFLVSDAQFAKLRNIYDRSTPTLHADIFDQIIDLIQSPTSLRNMACRNVVALFGADAQANRGVDERRILSTLIWQLGPTFAQALRYSMMITAALIRSEHIVNDRGEN